MIYNQIVTWTAFAILAMFSRSLRMGISLESWRGQLGSWEMRRGQEGSRPTKGFSGLTMTTCWRNVCRSILICFFALVCAAKCQREGFLRKMKWRELELGTLHHVFSLSARISELASHLMHDVETNPGPCENQVHTDSKEDHR